MYIIKVGVSIIAFAIILLIFILLQEMEKVDAKKAAEKTYRYVENQLKNNRGKWFNYLKIESFLVKNGAEYCFGKWMNPVSYIGMCMVLGAVAALWGLKIHFWVALIFVSIGIQLPKLIIYTCNQKENRQMLVDLRTVYNALAIQAKSGVYIVASLMECYLAVNNKRLKNGLRELSNEIATSADVKKALVTFENKFDNVHIDSLCVILEQALESGMIADLLQDISEQLADVEEFLMAESKNKLDKKIWVYEMLMFAGIVVVLLYTGIQVMINTTILF